VRLPAVEVSAVATTSMQVPVFEEVVGTVRPRYVADVAAKVTGRVLQIHATPGQRVVAGEVVVEIEAGELQAALAAAQANAAQSGRVLERARNLLATGAATQAEYDQADADHRVAQASLREAETAAAGAAVTAPFAGTVTRRYLEPGDLAVPGRPIFAIEDPDHLRLEVDLAESLAGRVEPGATFPVAVAAAGLSTDATVAEVAPAADARSRTFLVKLDLPDDPALRAGQFGRASVPRGERTALVVPSGSIVRRGALDYVYVVDPATSTATLRIVRAGAATGGGVEVLAGVEEGEVVVADPPGHLRDGQPVEQTSAP
jgi:RND family efflux transporter MFP subunit